MFPLLPNSQSSTYVFISVFFLSHMPCFCQQLVIYMYKNKVMIIKWFFFLGGSEQVIHNLQKWQQDASRFKISSNTDRLSDLKKIALEKGYRISDNEGSGNCMFYALSEQLETVKRVKIHHFELRRSLVQYLREHPKNVSIW